MKFPKLKLLGLQSCHISYQSQLGPGRPGYKLARLLWAVRFGTIYHQLADVLSTIVDLILVPKRRILCYVDTLALIECAKLLLLKPWMELELMSGRHNRCLFQQAFCLRAREVRDTNRSGLAGLDQLLHGFVCIDVVDVGYFHHAIRILRELVIPWLERGGPMHQVQINIVHLQILQGLVQSWLNISGFVLVVPELGGDEQLGSRDPALLDRGADHGLRAIYCMRV